VLICGSVICVPRYSDTMPSCALSNARTWGSGLASHE
jgi:hypothetical protein